MKPEDVVVNKFFKEHIQTIVETLNDREKKVIQLRFGLCDDAIFTLKEVGERFDLSRERIRQIESAMLIKLRDLVD